MAQHTIHGLGGVLDAMSRLETKVQKKAMSHALRAGAKPIQHAARTLAKRFDDPATAANIARDIKTRTTTKYAKRRGYDAGVGVGVIDSGQGGTYHHAWFREEGTATQPATPFMRPAAESQHAEALEAIVSDLRKSIFK